MIYLLLGSNLGDRRSYLDAACAMLEETLQLSLKRSSVLETEAVGFEGPDFLNMAVAFQRPEWLTPELMLDLCRLTEARLGRASHEAVYNEDGTRKYVSRTIDIDILKFDDVRRRSKKLRLPHPQIKSRPFAAQLLAELENNN